MKFGKYLEAEQVPEWAKMYVNYRLLKKLIKEVAVAKEQEAKNKSKTAEQASLLKRASTYLGYNSLGLAVGPQETTRSETSNPAQEAVSTFPGRDGPSGDCTLHQHNGSDAGCSHFSNIVSATPQIALSMSAENPGKVGVTSTELAHGANIKIPMSAQDSFTEGIRRRRTPASVECITADAFKLQLDSRLSADKEFFEQLEQELIKVNDFFKQKQTLFALRLDNIRQQQRIYDRMLEEEAELATLRTRPSMGKLHYKHRSQPKLASSPSTVSTMGASSISSTGSSAQLRTARSKIKRAMLELYRGMDMLKNYRILCYTAFVKALKKYQKTGHWCEGTDYFLNRVDSCYMSTSGDLNSISSQLETMYVNRYAGGSRSKGMDKLRVNTTGANDTHRGSIFRSGMMLGTSVPLIIRAIYEANLLSNEERVPYHRQLLQIYGSVFLVLLFLLLFSLNIMAWTKAHINYRFIFEVDPRDYLDAWQFLELSSLFFWLASVVVWVNFALHIDHNSYICIYVLLGVLLALFFMPVKVLYWSSRRWLIKTLWRLLLSGIYRVEFRDFFLGDEMCSLTYTFSMVLLLGCASAKGWTDLDDVCDTNRWWSNAAFLMFPNLLRLLQCIRRYVDSRNAFPHLANGAKYSSTIITIWLASSNRIVGGTAWRSVWVASAIANSCFTSLWDLLMDWGLFEARSKHRFLRSELKFERVWVYYAAAVTDIILRFVWITQISPTFFAFGTAVHTATIAYIAAVLEVVRRFLWNFLRVENEHISNCGQFRATTNIPLPFDFSAGQQEALSSDSEQQIQNEFDQGFVPAAAAVAAVAAVAAASA